MNAPVILQALNPVVRAFQELGITYHIGGSVASSAYGIARATLDVDLVADLPEQRIGPLVQRLQEAFYVDEDRVRDAVRRRSSFNIIHLESMIKVDVFVLKGRPYDRVAFARGRMECIDEAQPGQEYKIASPEDVIISKLDWSRQGEGVSERQWNDVLGILKVQQRSLDMQYLGQWAGELGLSDLLQQAMLDAGL